jgi:hypothetical protein
MPSVLLRSRFACALLVGAIAGAPREAAAQAPAGGEPPVDPAVEAFDQAMEYKVAESDCGSAVPFFEKAWSLRKSYEIAANYGQCEQHLGRHPHAAELLRWALDHMSVAATDVDKRTVEAVFEASRRKVVAVTITVNLPGSAVVVNGRPVGTAPLATPVFVEPGAVVVSATLPGHSPATARLPAQTEGTATTVALALQLASAAPLVPPPPAARPSLAPGIALGAVGLAAALAGVAVYGVGLDQQASAQALAREGGCTSAAACPQVERLRIDGNLFVLVGGTLALSGLGVGLGGGGYLLWAQSASRPAAPAALRVAPGLGSLWVSGRF